MVILTWISICSGIGLLSDGITGTNIDLSTDVFCDITLRAVGANEFNPLHMLEY